MGRNSDTALAMNILDDLRSRLSPVDVLIYSDGEQMKTGCCDLFAHQNSWSSREAGIPPTTLGREEAIVVRNCNSVQPFISRPRNKHEGREHAVAQEAVYMKIDFDNLITAASQCLSIWRLICECPPY
jgi:hypothetical protein